MNPDATSFTPSPSGAGPSRPPPVVPVQRMAPATQSDPAQTTATNQNAANAAIDQYARRLARSNGINVSGPNNPNLDVLKRESGFRPQFAQTRHGERSGAVITNFLELTAPPVIYVYRLEMIRFRNPTTNNPVLVAKMADKKWILEQLVPHVAPLGANSGFHWVSDGDLIWSTTPFLGPVPLQPPPANQPPPPPLHQILHNQGAGVDLSYNNDCGNQLHASEVNIHAAFQIPTTGPMPQIFPEANGAPLRRHPPEVLLRGLNAILTIYARSVAQQQQTLCTGAKKAYRRALADGRRLQANAANSDLLRALRGFFISARPGVEHILVNINTICSPFFAAGQSMQTLLDSQPFQRMSGPQQTSILEGLKVEINFPFAGSATTARSAFRFIRDIHGSRQQCHRDPTTNAVVTVSDCFRRRLACQNHQLPTAGGLPADGVLVVRVAFNMQDHPPPGGYEFYPADLLTITDHQPYHAALSPTAITNMIKHAREDASVSLARIRTDGMDTFGLRGQTNLGRFANMQTGTELLRIPAIWLNAPLVRYYRQNQPTQATDLNPHNASWNLVNVRFANTTNTVNVLRCIDLKGHGLIVANINTGLRTALRSHGILASPGPATFTVLPGAPPRSLTNFNFTPNIGSEQDIWTVLLQNNPSRSHVPLSVVLPNQDARRYASIKRVAELQLGFNTVLIHHTHNHFNAQKASNIAMKWNLKLGQVSHALPRSFQGLRSNGIADTIVIGADVTHPGKGSADACPSIAAVVGSVDDDFMHFPGSMRLQRHRKEYIVELGDMVKERLIDWAERHGDRLPDNMLFYRDGVSESQYAKLRSFEIPEIQKAYNWAREFLVHRQNGGRHDTLLDQNRNPWPPIANPTAPLQNRPNAAEEDRFDDNTPHSETFALTYVVVGKRHNTRFYPTANRDMIAPTAAEPNTNAKPGLLVDQVITHPFNFDFYLQSHNPIAGTGRSAHYVVLQNNMNLNTDQMHHIVSFLAPIPLKSSR